MGATRSEDKGNRIGQSGIVSLRERDLVVVSGVPGHMISPKKRWWNPTSIMVRMAGVGNNRRRR